MMLPWIIEIVAAITIALLIWIGRSLMKATTDIAVIRTEIAHLIDVGEIVSDHEKRIDKIEFILNK